MKLYLVQNLATKGAVHVDDEVKEIDLTFLEGMAGVIPVFKDKESAEKFADGKAGVTEIEVGDIQ